MEYPTPGAATNFPSPVPYKDRSTSLSIFGVLTILLGCMTGLMALLAFVGATHAQQLQPAAAAQPVWLLVLGVGMYAIIAAVLIGLGIGSMKAERWARALILIFCWVWLVTGILSTVMMAYLLPRMHLAPPPNLTDPNAQAAFQTGLYIGMFGVLGFGFIFMPAIWLLVYSGPNVKATCEARNPEPSWTDACPLPVLALSLMATIAVPMLLLLPAVGHVAIPFCGTIATGLAGDALSLIFAAISAYMAWLLYKVRPAGWWLLFGLYGFNIVSCLVTYAITDPMQLYVKMGYSQAMLDQLKQNPVTQGHNMMWLTLASAVPVLGYVLFVKKYFRAAPASQLPSL
jgi:hypothetical protein